MKHVKRNLTSTFLVFTVFSLLSGSNAAHADISINLNDFFFFPGDPVTISGDGSTATIGEDSFVSPIILSNDPGSGDPEVILAEIGGVGQILYFDWTFNEPGIFNDDEFGAFVMDSTGWSAGDTFEFFTQDSGFGSVSFDLSSLASEPFIGLQFQLSALSGDWDYDSTVTVSNVKLTPVPIPGAALLACLGMGTVSLLRKKKDL